MAIVLSIVVLHGVVYDRNHMKIKPRPMPAMTTAVHAFAVLAGVVPTPWRVPAGTTLFLQGDRTKGIFMLAEGAMRLLRMTPDGVTVTLHQVRPGEMFAEASLFSQQYHCDARADRDSVVGWYPKAKLMAQLRSDPEALWNFSRELAARLQSLRQRYELKQIRSAPERILQFIRLRCDGDGCLQTTGTLKEVATELGFTHEAFYRALAVLQRQGFIDRNTGRLSLLRPSRYKSQKRSG